MNLRLLCAAPQVDIYFDSFNDWIFIDWTGELTLPVVQNACVHIAHCFLQHPYPRVLNNNTYVTGLSWSIAPWLIRDFLPHLRLAGVKQLAWVCSPSLPGLSMVQTAVTWLPQLAIGVFGDVADGASWLERSRQVDGLMYPYPARSAATQAALAWEVQELARKAGLVQMPVVAAIGD